MNVELVRLNNCLIFKASCSMFTKSGKKVEAYEYGATANKAKINLLKLIS